MKISATHEYVGEEKLENLARTIIKHTDGGETIIIYRKSVGGDYVDESLQNNKTNMEPTITEAEVIEIEPVVVPEPLVFSDEVEVKVTPEELETPIETPTEVTEELVEEKIEETVEEKVEEVAPEVTE